MKSLIEFINESKYIETTINANLSIASNAMTSQSTWNITSCRDCAIVSCDDYDVAYLFVRTRALGSHTDLGYTIARFPSSSSTLGDALSRISKTNFALASRSNRAFFDEINDDEFTNVDDLKRLKNELNTILK